jgi:hypothetical protein
MTADVLNEPWAQGGVRIRHAVLVVRGGYTSDTNGVQWGYAAGDGVAIGTPWPACTRAVQSGRTWAPR